MPVSKEIPRKVNIKIPEQDFVNRTLLDMKPNKVKALVRDDLKSQGITVRLERCELIPSQFGSFVRIRTKSPEEAAFLKTPSTWAPMAFGHGAYMVTD